MNKKKIGCSMIGAMPLSELFYNFTVSLRKFCDSKATSAVYNLLYIESDQVGEAIEIYVGLVIPKLIELVKEQKVSQKNVAFVLESAAGELPSNVNPAVRALRCTMYLWSDDDWLFSAYHITEAITSDS